MLTPAVRMFDRPVLWNDAVQVGGTVIAGENPAAAGIGSILGGKAPLADPLREHGIRFVLVETGQVPAVETGRLGGVPVVTGPTLALYRLDGPVQPLDAAVRAPALVVVGDLLALLGGVACTIWLPAGKLRGRGGDRSGQG